MDEDERIEQLEEALVTAIGVIRHHHQTAMAAMAIEEEIERSWQHYIKTSPGMRQILAALGGVEGGADGQKG